MAPAEAATADPVASVLAVTSPTSSSGETVSDQQLQAAGYERMAVVRAGGATGTLWRIIEPAGAWTWHANLHNAAPGSKVWAENWFSNVVSSATVPSGEIGVNTGTWSSFGKFRVCFRLADGTYRGSYYSQT
ncbi:hypothetical protein [Lentzea aerocolonigenes]|uniref:hypothetical protein n=1 Tax=Lentzea aerocolonigenes TaxID=68170 RepID=UPI0012DFE061|nr:hypothetical protein [Lentzea aerocolonigenes]